MLGTLSTNKILNVSYPIKVYSSSAPSTILEYAKLVGNGNWHYVDDIGYNLNDTQISPITNHYFRNTTNNFIGYSLDIYWYY